jgi:hypothetical protein
VSVLAQYARHRIEAAIDTSPKSSASAQHLARS